MIKTLLLAGVFAVVTIGTTHAMPMVKAFTVESDTPSITQVWGGCALARPTPSLWYDPLGLALLVRN